jgi:hypothetical protein
MASRTLSLPLRAFAGTRPSIQAWRTTRSFATELAPASTTLPSATTPIITPVAQDASFETPGLKETDGSTSGKLRPVGVVVSAGKMQNTVKVRLPSQKWNNYLRKVTRTLQCSRASILCARKQCADSICFSRITAFQGPLRPSSPRPQVLPQHRRRRCTQTLPRRQTRPPRRFRNSRSVRHTHHSTATCPQRRRVRSSLQHQTPLQT